jgi:hypothetical protein
MTEQNKAQPASEWREDMGDVLWWRFPINEPPYLGSPLDLGQIVEVTVRRFVNGEVVEDTQRHQVGGWPGYHTHFTEIPIPHTPDAEAVSTAFQRS